MMYVMRTSGAESLSAAANVFMGQTEAPLIVRPYVDPMTRSELLALMVGGMATISGGVMAVYISLGADPVALLTASVMAAPGALYLTKIVLPELDQPRTRGLIRMEVPRTDVNVIDAASRGASDGTLLAINVAAMLIAFLALIALVDYVLGFVHVGLPAPDAAPAWFQLGRMHLGSFQGQSGHQTCTVLSLSQIFAVVFAPLAFLMGVPGPDIGRVADLLGTKLVANEFVAYVKLTGVYRPELSARATEIATIALCGFANFASIGIQLGGIGSIAPARRGDLSRLGMRALYCGFVATMINAAIAGMLLP
jgi:CNT family concentrative nucleoside transporter